MATNVPAHKPQNHALSRECFPGETTQTWKLAAILGAVNLSKCSRQYNHLVKPPSKRLWLFFSSPARNISSTAIKVNQNKMNDAEDRMFEFVSIETYVNMVPGRGAGERAFFPPAAGSRT